MTRSQARVLIAALGLLLSVGFASGTVLISDGFSLNESNRQVGSSLSGTMAEVGGATWAGDGTWKFTAEGTVQSASGSTDVSVPVTLGADPITVSVQMDFAGHTGTSYAMMGLINGMPTQPYNWPLWLFVRGNGQWGIRQVTTTLADGSGLDTSAGLHELKISYDPVTGLVGAWYDGAVLATDKALTDPPTFTRIGFGTSIGGMTADNFAVAVVPEPATLVLLALGGLLGVGRRR